MATAATSSKSDDPSGLPVANSSASFWLSEPSPFLLNHRTTPALPSTTDVAIIGSGITGASAARFLAESPRFQSHFPANKGDQDRPSITLLEAREICSGATGRNGGHCQPLLFDRSASIAEFELKNVDAVESYIQTHEIEEEVEWRKVVGCRTFWSKEMFEEAKKEVETLKMKRPEIGKFVECSQDEEVMKRHRVRTDTGCVGVTLTEGCGCLWPHKLISHMVEKLVREGRLNVQTNTPVLKIAPCEESGGRKYYRHTLTTARGTIQARHIILATNGYTSHLLPHFSSHIVPVRCEMSALHPPAKSARLPSSYGFVGQKGQAPSHDDYLIQRPIYLTPNGTRGGHLMFGGGRGEATYDCVGEWEDDVVDPGEAAYLRRTLLGALDLGEEAQGMKELKASHQWTGIKGFSRDNMPWVGAVPNQAPGLWISAGYTGHGMPNASLCAKAVVEMLLDFEAGVSYSSSCERLVKGKELPEEYVCTRERFERASRGPSVEELDMLGWMGPREGGGVNVARDLEEGQGGRCEIM